VLPPAGYWQQRPARYPAGLAAMARYHAQACLEGARQGYRTLRSEVAGQVPAADLDAILAVYAAEGKRLRAAVRAVVLVEQALRDRGTLSAG